MRRSDLLPTYSLTPMQKCVLSHCLADSRSGIYVEQIIGTLRDYLDLAAFIQAWQCLVDRHEVLRIRFLVDGNGGARQFSLNHEIISIDQYDWRNRSSYEKQRLFEVFLDDDRRRGFDSRVDLPIRVAVFQLDELEYRFVFTWWYGVLDSRSILILLDELFRFYEAFRQGIDLTIPLPRRFTEYTEWLVAQDITPSLSYWRDLLEDFTEPTPVGAHRLINTHESRGFGNHEMRLSQTLTSQLQATAKAYGVTFDTLVQAAWALVLSRYSGETDVVFGTTRVCRFSAFDGDGSGEEIVGCLVNTVPIRIKMQADTRVLDWLKKLQTQNETVRLHENSSLAAVQSCSGISADQHLFYSIVLYEDQLLDYGLCSQGRKWPTRLFEVRGGQTGFPLTVRVYGGPKLLAEIFNERACIDDPAAEQMLAHLVMAMQSLAERPHDVIADLPTLPDEEQQLLLVEWNRTGCPFPEEGSIQGSFAEQVARTPNAPALTCCGITWTYHELDHRAEGIARQLRHEGARPEIVIGIFMERCLDLVAGMLAILKTGAAYLPLDPAYPSDRLAFMVEDAKPLMVVSNHRHRGRLAVTGVPIFSVDDVDVSGDTDVFPGCKEERAGGHDLAYVIYTSGSTGKPKGVMVEHRNVMNFFAGMDAIYGCEAGVCLAVNSISFDPSIFDLFWTLTRGYHVVIWPGMDAKNSLSIPELIQAYGVTFLDAVPSFLRMVMMLPGGQDALASLQQIQIGGEALSPLLLRDLGPPSACRRIVNAYGPTETTVTSTIWEVDPGSQSIPIGRPIVNTQIFVLDRYRRPVPVGVAGELYVGGAGVARGYLNRPELTDQRFVPNPFSKSAGSRLYRTGDLVRYRRDGMLEFVGRIDHQVKIRGFRVELGEIETVVIRHPDLREAVIDLQEAGEGHKRLVAYCVTEDERMPPTRELREWVGRELPFYMVPAVFVALAEIPRTASGKLDRRALPPASESEVPADEDGRVPTAVEAKLLEIWCKVFNLKHVVLDDDFFDLGGDSLQAVAMIVAIEEHFRLKFPLEVLFRAQTVELLAVELTGMMVNDGRGVAEASVGSFAHCEPRTSTERRLHAIWERLLETRPIGIHDNFFNLQGNPALFDQMLIETRKTFNAFAEGLPVNQMLKNPTIEVLARIIDESIRLAPSLVVSLQPNGVKNPLFLIHAGGGYVFFYRALAERLGPDTPVYAVRAETSSDGMGLPFNQSKSIEEVASRYLAQIRTVQPKGPYSLGGASLGGVIVFEMAKQLRAQGEELGGPILLFDSFVSNNPHISREEETDILHRAGLSLPETFHDKFSRHLIHVSQLGIVSGVRYALRKILRNAPWLTAMAVRTAAGALRARLSRFAGTFIAETVGTDVTPNAVELRQSRIMEEFMIASGRLQTKYVPSEFEGKIVLFKAKESCDPEQLWTGLARGGVVVHQMPGVHLDMMEEPAVIQTAVFVRKYLV